MNTLRTVPNEFYIPPKTEDVEEKAKVFGLGKFPIDVVEDIVNLLSKGSYRDEQELRYDLFKKAETMLPLADNNTNQWSIIHSSGRSNTHTFENRMAAIKCQTEILVNENKKINEFTSKLDLSMIPGETPLSKAMVVVKALMKATKVDQASEKADTTLNSIMTRLPAGRLANDVNEMLGAIKNMTTEEMDCFCDISGGNGSDQSDAAIAAAVEALHVDCKEIIELSRIVDSSSAMKTFKRLEAKPDVEGNEIRYRPIKSINEMMKTHQSEFILPQRYRLYRVLTQQSYVRERISITEKKQLLYMLIDKSGSMRESKRIQKAVGILLSRVKAVISGDAEMWVSFFDTHPTDPELVATKEEAKALLKKSMSYELYTGGGTNIGNALKGAIKHIDTIMQNGQLYKPAIVLITDGTDDVKWTKKNLCGNILHSFIVSGSNRSVSNLATSSGGIAVSNL